MQGTEAQEISTGPKEKSQIVQETIIGIYSKYLVCILWVNKLGRIETVTQEFTRFIHSWAQNQMISKT